MLAIRHVARTPPLAFSSLYSAVARTARRFTVLALESSADDTCAAVVTSNREILSNVVLSQNRQLEQYGGIHPYISMQTHQNNMPIAIRRALRDANTSMSSIDGIAFTRGPGMPSSLAVTAHAAFALSAALNKPLVGVHHMQAHALTPFLTQPSDELPQYPFLTLLVSGGHTLLLLATSNTSFKILATSVDESIGWAFDRVARSLGIPPTAKGYGAALEAYCTRDAEDTEIPDIPTLSISLPNQMAFSYTGLFSRINMVVQKSGGTEALNDATRLALARAFQITAVAQLEQKLAIALRECRKQGIPIRHLVVSGGVASNAFLRQRLRICLDAANPESPVKLVFPPPSLCTDNAAMIAWASMHRFTAGDFDTLPLDLRAKWSLEDLTTTAPSTTGP